MTGECGTHTPFMATDPWRAHVKKDTSTWPLHAKNVRPMKLQDIMRDDTILPEYMPLIDAICNDCNEYEIAAQYAELCPESPIEFRHVVTLMAAGLHREIFPPEIPLGCTIALTTDEDIKKRLRFLQDTIADNVKGRYAPGVTFSRMGPLKSLAHYRYACVFDQAAYYYQIPISDEVGCRLSFMIIHEGKRRFFAPRRGLMGHKNFVFVGQVISIVIARRAAAECDALQIVVIDIIIDNTTFWSNDLAKLTQVGERFVELCAKYDMTLGEALFNPRQFDYRGLNYDLDSHTIGLKLAWITGKWTPRVTAALQLEEWTMAMIDSLAGMAAWAIAAMEYQTDMFFFWKFVVHAARSARGKPTRRFKVWKTTKLALQRLAEQVCDGSFRLKPGDRRKAGLDYVFVTDAAREGIFASWAALLFDPATGLVRWTTGSKCYRYEHENPSINFWEMFAVHDGYTQMKKFIPQGSRIVNFIDNTTAYSIILSGRSAHVHLYQQARIIRGLISAQQWVSIYFWVPSEKNPVDGLSRGSEFGGEDMQKLLRLYELAIDLVVPEEDYGPSVTGPSTRAFVLENTPLEDLTKLPLSHVTTFLPSFPFTKIEIG